MPRLIIALFACATISLTHAAAPSSPQPKSEAGPFQVSTVAEGLEHAWGLALLPDGRMLITERAGRLRLIDKNGKASTPLRGLPKIAVGGQGGLLDLTLSPEFSSDGLVYLSFSEPGEGGNSTAVARGKLSEDALEDVTVIWRQVPKVDSQMHFGSRIVFGPNDTMFITTGDRYNQRPMVQDLSTTIGKVVRIKRDGSIPSDNPFANRKDARADIWSYGHRNIQAAALHPQTNQLWTIEHGAKGGDELNNPRPGKNYGWPAITYGIDYSGVKIGEGTEKPGMEQPIYYWDPVIAPSGAVFYTGDAFKDWKGDLLVGSMVPGGLVRLEMEGGKVVKETRYLGELRERIRDVQQAADGSIVLITDSPKGKVLRLEPTP